MKTLTLTTVRVLTLAMICLLSTPSVTGAATRSSTTPFTPGDSAYNTCSAGAECTGSATADGDGTQTVASSVTRSDVTETNEWSEAYASGSVATRASQGTDHLHVTFTWRVDSAKTEANSTTLGGVAVGRVFADGQVTSCMNCRIEGDTNGKDVMVASTYSDFGPVPPHKITPAGSLVSHTLTVKARDGSPLRSGTKMTLAGRTRAFSYVGGPCDGTCGTAPHSGTASAEAELQLISITMKRGTAPDEPVLLDL